MWAQGLVPACSPFPSGWIQVCIIPSPPKGWQEEEEGKISPGVNSDYLVWCPQSRRGWKVLSHWAGLEQGGHWAQRAELGAVTCSGTLGVIHHVPCPVTFLCLGAASFGLANNGAPNEFRKQNHNAPSFIKLVTNANRHCGEHPPQHGKVFYLLLYNLF